MGVLGVGLVDGVSRVTIHDANSLPLFTQFNHHVNRQGGGRGGGGGGGRGGRRRRRGPRRGLLGGQEEEEGAYVGGCVGGWVWFLFWGVCVLSYGRAVLSMWVWEEKEGRIWMDAVLPDILGTARL